jgi:hypothetical protein
MKNENHFVPTNDFSELMSLVSSFQKSMNECNEDNERLRIVSLFFKDINIVQKNVSYQHFGSEYEGHSLFLQGVSLPIVINSICDEFGEWKTSGCSIRIGKVDGEDKVIVTPDIISIP